jgi:hypothetical protein
VIVAFASEVPVMVGVLSFVRLPVVGEVITGAVGMAVSMVSVIAVDGALWFSAASVAVAVTE